MDITMIPITKPSLDNSDYKYIKKVLKSKINELDDYNSYSLKADYLKENIKIRSKTILEKIKKLKN